MQTPWSHQAIREEFDEEIRLLILAIYEAAADETKGRMHVGDHDEHLPVAHARQLTLWSLAVLYAPWMSTPVDASKLITHATRHFEALRHQHPQLHGAASTPAQGPAGDLASTSDADAGTATAAREIELLNALACAAAASVPGARETLESVLAEHDQRWWEPRYGLVMETLRHRKGPHTHLHLSLATNVAAIGTYLLLSEVTQEHVWADRARAIAYALHHALSVKALAEHFALTRATGERPATSPRTAATGSAASYPLTPAIDIDEATAVYFLWVRNLLHLRANLVEAGDEAPEWMFTAARDLYQWVRATAWREDGRGLSPSLLPMTPAGDAAPPIAVLAEAVGATEALGKTLEHIGGNEEWLAQLSHNFAIDMTWADHHLRHAPGQWGPQPAPPLNGLSHEECAVPSTDELSEIFLPLSTPLMLVRLPLAPSIPTALAQGRVVPWGVYAEQG